MVLNRIVLNILNLTVMGVIGKKMSEVTQYVLVISR